VLVIHGIWSGVDRAMLSVHGVLDHSPRHLFILRFGYLGTPMPSGANVEGQADLYAALLDRLAIPRSQW
jgi:hypothetical protein